VFSNEDSNLSELRSHAVPRQLSVAEEFAIGSFAARARSWEKPARGPAPDAAGAPYQSADRSGVSTTRTETITVREAERGRQGKVRQRRTAHNGTEPPRPNLRVSPTRLNTTWETQGKL
jgi:hypothetical protein